MNKIIPIFFTIDDAYSPYLAVALKSAIDNSSKERRYRAIIVHQGLSDENMRLLSSLATDNFEVCFTPMKEGLEFLTDTMGTRLRCDYFTLTIYFRLFIAAMFPEYDKAVYIDSDVAVIGDVAELYDTDIGDNFVGACNDFSVMGVPELVYYIENGVGVKKEEYINSGVLVMNLKKLREYEFDKHILDLLSNYGIETLAPDQDLLNATCNGKIYYLSERWNTMPNAGGEKSCDTAIIHYNLCIKPWCYKETRFGEYFWEYAERTPYYERLSYECENYPEEKRENDSKCTALLVERGLSLPNSGVTLASLRKKGVRIKIW